MKKEEFNTIEDFNSHMTIFYGKETGTIRGYVGGIQTLEEYYGEGHKDFNYETIVLPRDNYVLDNIGKFIVVNGKLMIKPSPSLVRYEVADI